MAKRASGAKLFFYTMHGEGRKLQIMADARRAPPGAAPLFAPPRAARAAALVSCGGAGAHGPRRSAHQAPSRRGPIVGCHCAITAAPGADALGPALRCCRQAKYDFEAVHGLTRRGDIVGVKGYPGARPPPPPGPRGSPRPHAPARSPRRRLSGRRFLPAPHPPEPTDQTHPIAPAPPHRQVAARRALHLPHRVRGALPVPPYAPDGAHRPHRQGDALPHALPRSHHEPGGAHPLVCRCGPARPAWPLRRPACCLP